jgi:hypothetical protein
MSYLTLLKNIIATEYDTPLERIEPPSLKIVVDNSKGEVPAPGSQRQSLAPLQGTPESNLVEVIQWRVRALVQIKRRLAGYVPAMPLSAQDAEVYRRMIDGRCQTLGLDLDDQQQKDLSVLSVPGVHANSEMATESPTVGDLPTTNRSLDLGLGLGAKPTKPTKGES